MANTFVAPKILGHVVRQGAEHVTICGFGIETRPQDVALAYFPSQGYSRIDTGEAFPYQDVCQLCRKRCLPADTGAAWRIRA